MNISDITKSIHKKRSIFLSWMLSYMLILVFPLCIYFIAYAEAMSIIENEVNQAHEASLNQLQKVIDDRLKDIEKLSMEIVLNEKIRGLAYLKESIEPYHRYTMVNLVKDFKTFKAANRFIDDFYIYFKHHNFILSYTGRYDAGEFYSADYGDQGVTYGEWLKTMQDKHVKDYILLSRKNECGQSKRSIAFIHSLSTGDDNLPEATLVIQIDEDTIQSAIQSMKWVTQGTILIVNTNNHVLSSTKPFGPAQSLEGDNFKNSQGIFHIRSGNEKLVISYITSGITDWKYVSILPQAVFLEKAKYIKRIILACVTVCLFAGGWIAYFFARKNYNPVYKMMQIFSGKTGLRMEKECNEFSFIHEAILHIIDEKEKINRRLEQQKDILRNIFLMRLIKGRIDKSTSLEDACESYDIHFESSYFAVMLFCIEDSGNLLFERDAEHSGETQKIVYFIIRNVVEELAGQKHLGYVAELDDMLVCLINFKEPDQTAAKEEMNRIACEAGGLIRKEFGISFSVSISDVHQTLSGIPKAYQETVEAIEYKVLMGSGRIIHYGEISRVVKSDYRYPNCQEDEQKFLNCIKVKDYKSAQSLFNEMVGNFSRMSLPVRILKYRVFGLVNSALNAVSEISMVFDEKFMEELKPVERLLKCQTIFELKNLMSDILCKADDHMEKKQGKPYDHLIDDTVNFIHSSYQDMNLSVSTVADRYQVSAAYLSKFFKKFAGMGLLDYIHKIRIEKAKEYLKETDLSIREIAERTGYYNSISFIRVFKKYEGITPGKFKELV